MPAGLRAPSQKTTFIVEVKVDDLFTDKPDAFKGTVTVHEIDFKAGDGVGIRDLAVLDGHLIALTGPSASKDKPALAYWSTH